MTSLQSPVNEKAEVSFIENADTKVDPEQLETILEAEQALLGEGRGMWEVAKENKRACLSILSVLIAMVVSGTDGTMSNALVGSQSFCKVFGGGYMTAAGKYAIPAKYVTIWSAVNSPPTVLSVPLAGWFVDRFGRRACMFVGLGFMVLGGILQLVATNWKVWTASKIIWGMVGGFILTGGPTYVSEVAPREIRGMCIAAVPLMSTFGIFLSAFVTYYSNQKWPSADVKWGYRVPMIVTLCLPFLILVVQIFLTIETPYWLIMKGRHDEAKKNMRTLYPGRTGHQYDLMWAEYMYILGKEAEQKELEKGTSLIDCLRGSNLRRTFCAMFPQMSQSLSGNSLIATQATYFFTLAGQTNSLRSTTISHGIGVLAYVMGAFLVEVKWLGRFRLLLIGQGILVVAMFLLGAITTHWSLPYPIAAADIILFAICLGVVGADIGPGASGYTYLAESGSARLRGKTASYGVVGNGLLGVVFTTAIPYMLIEDGGLGINGTAFFFGSLAVLCCILTYLFVPDYTGRSYAQIDELFQRRIPARRFRVTECTGDYGRDVYEPRAMAGH